MRICVFGLGYVGCVSGACLAKLGHHIIGVDTNPLKTEMINNGKSPVVEQGIDTLIADVIRNNQYSATLDVREAMDQSDVGMICVGTPSRSNGSLDKAFIRRVSEQIGAVLRNRNDYFDVVVRSTVLPGTVDELVIPTIETVSGKKAGEHFGVCMNPEFLREGTSVKDFFSPPTTVIGEIDSRSGELLQEIYTGIDAPIVHTNIKTAEMVKYVDNCFHALKICFANEIGSICKMLGVDSHEVMDIFCRDHKLNISPAYLKPGFAFGGSCLPKDLRAITYESKILDLEVPMMSSILTSNHQQITRVISKLLEYRGKTIGFMGLSFKGGTDDLRESPLVEVIETLIGKGFSIRIYDKNVSIARLMGANKEYIEKQIPHISRLMCKNCEDLIAASDVVVIGNNEEEFRGALSQIHNNHTIIDLVRIINKPAECNGNYYGISW
ncbi:MAG: nucleotide sugar dehydrogenase [Chitinivibrionales bacterium]|nr:nucleotide sugar dehydrogenase [Chitinivibrionales bacterium]